MRKAFGMQGNWVEMPSKQELNVLFTAAQKLYPQHKAFFTACEEDRLPKIAEEREC